MGIGMSEAEGDGEREIQEVAWFEGNERNIGARIKSHLLFCRQSAIISPELRVLFAPIKCLLGPSIYPFIE